MVSTSSRSTPPAMSARASCCVGGLYLVEGDDAEAGIVGVGRVGERDGQRPDGPGDKALTPGFIGDAIGPFAALLGGCLVDLPGQAR